MAQRGYNYVRPEAAVGAANTAKIPTSNELRPTQAAFQATGPTGPTYPTAATAFGGAANVNPNAFVGGFVGQQGQPQVYQSGVVPTAVGGAFVPGNAGATLSQRPGLSAQRTTGGIYASGAQRPFTAGVPGAGAGGLTATGTGTGLSGSYENGDFSAIPGIPGVDYPLYSQVPPTSFDCVQQPLPGYYADVEAQCQVWHICALNRTYSFLCPNGTIFSQETLVCVWWNQFDCSLAPSLYANNAYIYDYSNVGSTSTTTNVGFPGSTAQLGISSMSRQQANFISPNTVRTTSQNANIYGAGGLRTALAGGSNFAGGAAPIQAGFNPAAAARFTPGNAVTATPTFPTGSTGGVTPAATFGAVIGRTGGGNAATDNISNRPGVAGNVYQNAPAAGSTANREYLPPRGN